MPETCNRVISAITRHPWAILPEYLSTILDIASREYSNPEAVLAARAERHETGEFKIRDGVAIIPIIGPIMPRADLFCEISGATSIESLSLKFNAALTSADVKRIIFHVDSPGGQIVGVHELAGMILRARGQKPIIAYVSGLCASAAYWLASAAGVIVADATATIGSIGVVAAWTDDKEARKAEGLKDYELVSSQTPKKRLDPATKEGRAALQAELDALAEIFIADVARHRGKHTSTVQEKFGQGGTMLADEAVKVGMIDSIGNLEGILTQSQDNPKITIGGSLMTEEEKRRLAAAAKSEEDKEDKESAEDKEKEDDEATKGKAKKASKPKAKDEEDEDKESKEDDEEDAKARKATLAERARIKAILDLGITGHEALVKKALFDEPMSAQDLSYAVLMAEKKARANVGASYAEDARAVAGVPSSPVSAGREDRTSEYADMIAAGFQKRSAMALVK